MDPSESFPDEDGDGTVEVEVQPPYPFNQSLLSSEESEDEEQDEATDLPSHPGTPNLSGWVQKHTEAEVCLYHRFTSDVLKSGFNGNLFI